MTERNGAPEPEDFAARVRAKMAGEGRKWAWLSEQTEIHVNTLRSQLIEKPASLKYATALRVASALDVPMWGEVAA